MVLATSCSDAPRDNPLDPLSPMYKGTAVLSGSVTVMNQNIPIAHARATSLEDGISVVSDSLGEYRFERLRTGSHTIVCEKEMFESDTQRIEIKAGESQRLSFALNGYPVVSSNTILTRKIDQFFPSPQYYVEIKASVTDPNAITDIDSVWFTVESLQFPMTYSPTTKKFETSVYKYDVPTNSIDWFIGKPLRIVAADLSKARGVGDPFYVTRVIESGATPLYPSLFNSDTTGATPLLRWSPPTAAFDYTYTLAISRIDGGIQSLVWTYSGLISFYEELQFPGDSSGRRLDPGDYVWTVTVVDEFGNLNRSKESFFVVR